MSQRAMEGAIKRSAHITYSTAQATSSVQHSLYNSPPTASPLLAQDLCECRQKALERDTELLARELEDAKAGVVVAALSYKSSLAHNLPCDTAAADADESDGFAAEDDRLASEAEDQDAEYSLLEQEILAAANE